MKDTKEDIYDPEYVTALFDNMSATYDRMNTITSFGFSNRWRKQFLKDIELDQASVVVDLMTGMGECWANVLKKAPKDVQLIGIDLSEGMLKHARKRQEKLKGKSIKILKLNIFDNSLPENNASHVISGFGLKTFNEQQLQQLAKEIKRLLKPGGYFSLVDVSVPQASLLRSLYMFYLKNIIPVLGRVFLGNPENYRMLGIYTQEFENAKNVVEIFQRAGLESTYVEYFYGCASGVKGKKPQH